MILQNLDSTNLQVHSLKQQTDLEIEDYRLTTQSFLTQSNGASSDYFDEEIIRESKVQEIIRESKTQDNELLHYYRQHINEIIKLQVFFRNTNKKMALKKQAKKRKLVLQELLMTEKVYLNDLKLIINNVMLVSNYQKILPELEIDLAFRNIISIYNLNSQFYKELQSEFLKFTDTSIFGSIFLKYIPFFKIYFEYISDFQDNTVKILREKYPQFNEHLRVLETANLFRGCTFEAFLIKPVQRLPKYSLLLKELVKYTWESHPDYESLKLTEKQFLQVTKQINSLMGNILQNQALFDLQSKFFDYLNINIVESTRKYLLNESVCYFKKGKEQQVNIYLCSDMIVLSKRSQKDQSQERLICYHYFDEKSKIIFYKDNKSLMIVLTFQEETLTFTCSDLEQKEKVVQQLQYIQNNIIKRNQTIQIQSEINDVNPIRVFVHNITRGKSKMPFKTYAKYELVIKTKLMEFNTWTRHKKLAKIQKQIFQIYNKKQIQLQGKDQKIFSDVIIDGKLNKLHYDERKIIVEQFLETLLNSQLIKQDPQPFLKLLQLPDNFFFLIQVEKEKVGLLKQF